MQESKKTKFILIVSVVLLIALVAGAAGFAIGFSKGKNSDSTKEGTSEPATETPMYATSVSLYVRSADLENKTAISSDDLVVDEALLTSFIVWVQSEETDRAIRKAVSEKHPAVQYEIQAEHMKETSLVKLTVKSENPENLADICDMIASFVSGNYSEISTDVNVTILASAPKPKLFQ